MIPRPYLIGLTGNIATGKSTVLRLMAERGALTIDADRVVHALLGQQAIIAEIAQLLGPAVIKEDGMLDRPTIGRIVFADADKLRQLEAILHPAVRQQIAQTIAQADEAVIVIEAIKLIGSPLGQLCHEIWVTTCSAETQIARLQRYRQLDESAARLRVEAQAPQADKLAQADVIINTEGDSAETERQLIRAWAELPPIKSPEVN